MSAFEVFPYPRVEPDAAAHAAIDAQLALAGEDAKDLERVAMKLEAQAGASSPPAGNAELETIGSLLASLLTDLEAADGPPTGPQRELAARLAARVAKAVAP